MQCLSDEIENDRVVFVQNFKDLRSIKNLKTKSLCIIKTDFRNLSTIKNFMKSFPDVEVWLTSSEISRKHILNANLNGFGTVVQYPVDLQLVRNFLSARENKVHTIKYENTANLNRARVMIVDDNPMNIELLVETLKDTTLDIITFQKPVDAINAINVEKFDLFLLDIMMPDISGFDLAEFIKKSALNSSAPIMFISALSDSENKIRGYGMGSYAYIEKPFDINVVKAQILNVLKMKILQEALTDKKETFFALVTHDLKSPIAGEITALEYLMENYSSKMNPIQSEILADILEAAKYMKSLVDNILNKYKSDNGQLKLKTQKYSLNSLVTECLEETKFMYFEKNQTVKYSCPEINTDANIDCIEMKRVIHNILSNAYEYAAKNSQISVKLNKKNNKLIFIVENKSSEMGLKNPNEIFEKFISYAKEQKKIGTGLGLYVSKKIIEAHGGKIYAETKPHNSVAVTFELDEYK